MLAAIHADASEGYLSGFLQSSDQNGVGPFPAAVRHHIVRGLEEHWIDFRQLHDLTISMIGDVLRRKPFNSSRLNTT